MPTAIDNDEVAKEIVEYLRTQYEKVTVDEWLTYLLGMNVTQTEDGIFLSMEKYITEMLSDAGLEMTKRADAPQPANTMPVKAKPGDPTILNKKDHKVYRSRCGQMNFLVSSVRMDMTEIANKLSRYMQEPNASHKTLMMHALRY